jgi:hypothetical protein
MKSRLLFPLIFFLCVGVAHSMERSAVVTGSRVQMHESPSGDSRVVGLFNKDTTVKVIGRTEKPDETLAFIDFWYHVEYRGKAGWVFGQFINPSSGGRGLAGIFTEDDLVRYCALSAANLANCKNAKAYRALIDSSILFISDIKQITEDPILSRFARAADLYGLLANCYLAMGYAGVGDFKDAQKIRKQLPGYSPSTLLPDKTTLDSKIDQIDTMIQGKEELPK